MRRARRNAHWSEEVRSTSPCKRHDALVSSDYPSTFRVSQIFPRLSKFYVSAMFPSICFHVRSPFVCDRRKVCPLYNHEVTSFPNGFMWYLKCVSVPIPCSLHPRIPLHRLKWIFPSVTENTYLRSSPSMKSVYGNPSTDCEGSRRSYVNKG